VSSRCAVCKQPLVQRRYEGHATFATRKTCSVSCKHEWQRAYAAITRRYATRLERETRRALRHWTPVGPRRRFKPTPATDPRQLALGGPS